MKAVKIGIDFGTTYSFAAFLHGENVMPLIPSKETYGIPSVFYYDGNTKLVGRMAERRAVKNPSKAIYSIKRKLGQKTFRLGDRTFTTEEIITEIISYVVACAEEQLETRYMEEYDEIHAVITVPVDFSEPMKHLIRSAASKVTLKNGTPLRITGTISEPVAAAIEYFGLRKETDANILVLDLGGGTFDVAFVRAHAESGKPYEVIDQEGDKNLGGDDWDRALAYWMIENYQKEKGVSVSSALAQEFLRTAREVKEELTDLTVSSTSISIKGDEFDIEISRSEFEGITKFLLERVTEKVEKLLKRQEGKKIDHVILTGGSSYMPQIKASMVQRFGSSMDIRLLEPERTISYGGARYAATRVWNEIDDEGKAEKKIVDLIATHSYGVVYNYASRGNKDMICILIRKGEKLPASNETTSTTRYENQTQSYFRICESDYIGDETLIEVSEGHEIMAVTMTRKETVIPKGSKSTETLSLSEDGILTIRSVDERSGIQVENSVSVERVIT